MEGKIVNTLNEIGRQVEEKLDQEIQRLDHLKTDDLEEIRAGILRKRKARFEQEKKWRDIGHGEYSEVQDEKEFFNLCKKSERIVLHFYRNETERCKIFDLHLKILAQKHVETRFLKIDADKAPFLCSRLATYIIPSLILFKDNSVVDRIVGFTELGNRDDYTTEILEWRLAQKDVIEYDGDKLNPPEKAAAEARRLKVLRAYKKGGKCIRGKDDAGGEDSSDDDGDDN